MSSTLRPSRAPQASARVIAVDIGADLTEPGTAPDGEHATPADVPHSDGPCSDVIVSGVTLDSRLVQRGDLYAALPGAHAHGAQFGAQAAAAGAAAVLTDPAGAALLDDGAVRLPRIVVPDPRAVLGRVSAAVYGHASAELLLIGITGTNGKTTTAYILDAALRALGRTTGLIGTIEIRIGADAVPAVRTTPESCDLHGLFARMLQEGVSACVMEVSSHALALHRVDGVTYDVAVFTNMSQDHLDFHVTMEDYYAAKAALFTPERSRRGIVCVDDEWGARLAREATVPVTTLATRPDAAGEAQWRLVAGERSAGNHPAGDVGTADPDAFELAGPEVTLRLRGALPGGVNRINTALAALALLACGTAPGDVERALAGGARVPGRMERVELGSGAPRVYVDFAHTPEAIRATLAALRPLTRGRLVAVVGAGGNRDRGKRPLMGAAAARGADAVVVTDDNPRDEDAAAIRADVAAGAIGVGAAAGDTGAGTDVEILDVAGRDAGIARALSLAGPTAQFGSASFRVEVERRVKDAAAELSRLMGAQGGASRQA